LSGHQQLKRPEFLRAERQRLAGPARGAPGWIEADAAMLEHGRQRWLRAAEQRANTRDQLGEGKRLRQVVISAELQAIDAVLDGRRRSQHKHAAAAAMLDQARAYLVAGHPRQI